MPNNLIFTANDINSLSDRVGSVEQRFDIKNSKHNRLGTVTDYTTVPNSNIPSLKIYSAVLSIKVPSTTSTDVQLRDNSNNLVFSFQNLTFSTAPAVYVNLSTDIGCWLTTTSITSTGTNIWLHTRDKTTMAKLSAKKTITVSIIAIGY